MARSSFWIQLRALLIRNFLIKYYEKRQTIVELVMPLFFILILIFVHLGVPITKLPELIIPQTAFSLSSTNALRGERVGVVCSSKAFVNTLEASLILLGASGKYFENNNKLLQYYEEHYNNMNFSVHCQHESEKNAFYIIKTRPELDLPPLNKRYASKESCHPLFSANSSVFYANEMNSDCPARKYYDVGFVQLQTIVDSIFLKNATTLNVTIEDQLNLSVLLFPKKLFKGNTDYLRNFVPIYMAIAFTPFVAYLCILIVGEKEKKIKETMKLMGLRESVYWLGWLITYGALVLILSVVSSVLLVKAKIIPNANIFLIFVLIFLYGLSTITVAFLVTPFFNSAKAAGGFASFSSAVVSCLYYLAVYITDVPPSMYYIMSLLAPTAFALGMDNAVYIDLVGNGINFHNFWKPEGFGFGSAVVMLAVDTILYGFLAFYFDNIIPGEYGRKRPPWFIFTRSFWLPKKLAGNNNYVKIDPIYQGYINETLNNPNFETISDDLIGKEALRIFNIQKVYSECRKQEVVAVDGITLDIYEGQITAILGHNGAGKTTLLNMLTGLTNPSRGTATIYGLDISDPYNYHQLWDLLGICPQQDVLFDVLTPKQHLEFIGRIKGISETCLQEEVLSILKNIDLIDKKNASTGKLSGGQKRRLSIGMALIGDPKVVILDEPTSGVDPFSRRQLWNLLQISKAGKLIILTTHFMDEADILADRKVIMSKGKVKCVGSSLFLKNRFGLGYHLTMAMEKNYDEEKVTQLVHSVIRKSEKIRNNASELAFLLPLNKVHKFPKLLSALDEEINYASYVGIKSYGMSMTTLEEVFLKLCDDDNVDDLRNLRKRELLESNKFVLDSVPVSYNWRQAFAIMMYMNILGIVRQPRQIFSTVVLPIALIAATFYLMSMPTSESVVNYVVPLNISFYPHSTVLYTNNSGKNIDVFLNELSGLGLTLKHYNQSFAKLLFQNDFHIIYLNITSFDPQKLTISLEGIYNDTAQHSLPIMVNIINNAVSRMTAKTLDKVSPPRTWIGSEPLPRQSQLNNISKSLLTATILIGTAYNIMVAVYTANSVEDRESKIKHQLQISGLKFSVYWFSKLCGNYILFFVALVATIIVIEAFQVQPLIQAAPIGILILGFMFYMVSALLFGYCFGYFFSRYDTAQSFVGILYMILGLVPYVAVSITDMLNVNAETSLLMHCIFTICLPLYSPFAILYFINKTYSNAAYQGLSLTSDSYFSSEIKATLIILPIQAVILVGVLWVVDFRSSNGQWSEIIYSLARGKKNRSSFHNENSDFPQNEDDDVLEERRRVKSFLQCPSNEVPVVVIDGLRKEFVTPKVCNRKKGNQNVNKNTKIAVRNFSLAIQKGEVFGLLGPNGAGKTTALRTIVADEVPTKGKILIAGYDLNKELKRAIWNMSYCPQHDSLWKHVTVKEHLECYANIRGVKPSIIKQLVITVMNGLSISEHANKTTENLSGGTKRKLSYALSMLGDPKVVLLDEPSTGMDPKSKRYLWDTIIANFQGSRGAILTTHSMEEADFLSSRVGIMVEGELRCVGSTQHLKSKYGSGYILEAKVMANQNRMENIEKVDRLIMQIFPQAILQEKFQDRVRYQVPQTGDLSLAQVFATLEEVKREVDIEEYSFSQTSLEQLFLDFAKKQNYEEKPSLSQIQDSVAQNA